MGFENSQLRKVREDMVKLNEVINLIINFLHLINAEKRNQLSFLPFYDIKNIVMLNKTLSLQINV